MTKLCSRCKIEKPLSQFSKDKQHSSGYKSACKTCAAGDFKNWRAANLEQARYTDRVLHYTRKYGLSLEEAEQFTNNREGICPLCSRVALLVIDHCHTTGKIRGYICSSCNSTLGYAKDNVSTLEKCIVYLKDFYELSS